MKTFFQFNQQDALFVTYYNVTYMTSSAKKCC